MMNNNSSRNNTSNITCIDYHMSPSREKEPQASEDFRTIFMAFSLIFALVGNSLVLRGAIKRRNRPFVYYLVINLSIAEIIIAVLQPFEVVVERSPFIWVFGNFLCRFVKSLGLCARMVVTSTLAAIAVFRALIMIQPKRNRPSKRFAFSIMIVSWLWGASFALPHGLNHQLFQYPACNSIVLKICKPIELNRPVFETAYFVAFFLIPFALMVASYGIVIYRLKKHIHSKETRKESFELPTVDSTRGGSFESEVRPAQLNKSLGQRPSVPNDRDNISKDKQFKFEKDVLNMLYILILVFFICYLPWIIMYILLAIAKVPSATNWSYKKIFEWYMTLLYSLPSALHPICYGAASKVIDINFRFPCNRFM